LRRRTQGGTQEQREEGEFEVHGVKLTPDYLNFL
jgi:hypothetical protein